METDVVSCVFLLYPVKYMLKVLQSRNRMFTMLSPNNFFSNCMLLPLAVFAIF